MNPATLATLTTAPRPRSTMPGSAAWHSRSGARTMTSRDRSSSASGVSGNRVRSPKPALLTSRSTGVSWSVSTSATAGSAGVGRQVGRQHPDAPAVPGGELVGLRAQPLLVPGDQHQVVATRGQRTGEGGSDAGGRTGDDARTGPGRHRLSIAVGAQPTHRVVRGRLLAAPGPRSRYRDWSRQGMMGRVGTVLAVANQKGGVAKTTTVASLGAGLVELGQRVLLVDLDPQACLTFSLGIDPEDLERSVHQVLLGEDKIGNVLVTVEEGPDLLPATIDLAAAEPALLTRTGREHLLRVALEEVADDYDWVIVDCPPTLGVLTVAALSAADQVLVPLQCETLSHRGVGQLLDTIHDVRRFTNPDLVILGVLPTLYDGRTQHARTVLDAISSTYDLDVLEPPVPKTIRFAEAPALGRSILSTSRTHKGAEAYRALARGLVGRRRHRLRRLTGLTPRRSAHIPRRWYGNAAAGGRVRAVPPIE